MCLVFFLWLWFPDDFLLSFGPLWFLNLGSWLLYRSFTELFNAKPHKNLLNSNVHSPGSSKSGAFPFGLLRLNLPLEKATSLLPALWPDKPALARQRVPKGSLFGRRPHRTEYLLYVGLQIWFGGHHGLSISLREKSAILYRFPLICALISGDDA